jgi:hypothetical protein
MWRDVQHSSLSNGKMGLNGRVSEVTATRYTAAAVDRRNLHSWPRSLHSAAMNILTALADYDGKHNEPLESILRSREATPDVLDELVALSVAEDANVATGATWLLRAWVEEGLALHSGAVSSLAERLSAIDAPWARQHVCQTVPSLAIASVDAPLFFDFLEECRASERPFLRAWAMDGLCHLAQGHPDFQARADAALQAGLSDGAPSVRARARRILEGK